MKQTFNSFLMGSLGLIALFLVLAHASGFAQDITSGAGGLATDFKTLQGR